MQGKTAGNREGWSQGYPSWLMPVKFSECFRHRARDKKALGPLAGETVTCTENTPGLGIKDGNLYPFPSWLGVLDLPSPNCRETPLISLLLRDNVGLQQSTPRQLPWDEEGHTTHSTPSVREAVLDHVNSRLLSWLCPSLCWP